MGQLAAANAASASILMLLLLLGGVLGGTQAKQQQPRRRQQQQQQAPPPLEKQPPEKQPAPLKSASSIPLPPIPSARPMPKKTEFPTYSPSTNTLAPSVLPTDSTSTLASTDNQPTPPPPPPSIAPTQKPSYEKAIPLTGPIQCKSLVASQEDEEDTITPPTLDGITDEWTNVTVYELPLISNLDPTISYPRGNGAVQMQCVYDAEKVYFVFHVPGMYAAGGEDNVQMNAAISTIFKIGQDASLSNMGNCPNADDCTTALESCESYKVDWQLMSSTISEESSSTGTIDDKYSVSLECRYDDDADNENGGGNEWEGAWMHYNLTAGDSDRTLESSSHENISNNNTTISNLITMAEVRKHNSEYDLWMVLENKVYDFTDFAPIHPGGPGYLTMYAGMDATDPFQAVHYGVYARAETAEYYIGDLDISSRDEWVFEMSRPLKTDSTTTDAQFVEGSSVEFGFSFWDPFETEERGWTNSGYYTTGSTADWTSIQFGEQSSVETKVESTSSSTTTIASISTSNSAASFMSSSVPSFGCMCMFVVCAHRMIFDAY